MLSYRIFFILISSFLLLTSCGQNLNKNLEKLDKIYGKCDNPQRTYNELQYKICKDQERAGQSKEALDLNEIFNPKSSQQFTYTYQTNKFLWDASLSVLDNYPLKIADSEGGYIETDWIIDPYDNLSRCLIKVNVTSSDLISTGVNTAFLCQNFVNNNWANITEEYINEEKQLTLKILSEATKQSQLN